jgi:asparagine synthase (glutamine-hydrolysing)
MCGIAGVFNARSEATDLDAILQRMTDSLIHRGPDASGLCVFPALGAGVACRRLSLVDVATGGQPVLNESGDIALVMNGAIYNYRELRCRLEQRGHRFRGASDTEVIVHLYEDQGVDCLNELNGMFALAILDARAGRLLLARDGAGMKPLYWTEAHGAIVFGSEVKALKASGRVDLEPDWSGIDTFLSVGYIPAPGTCFRGIRKLAAGEYVLFHDGTWNDGVFWRFRFTSPIAARSEEEYADELERLLRTAVRSHLDADVPVGAFISGGWDSSLVATYAAQASATPLRTFSLVFPDDPDADESRYSRAVAHALGSDHAEVEFRNADMQRILPALMRHLEEPCTATPVLLDYHLSAAAGPRVKAVVGGEGSDELFAGYPWLRSAAYYRLRPLVPRPLAKRLQEHVSDRRLVRACGILGAGDEVAADMEWFRAFTVREKNDLLHRGRRGEEPDLRPVRPPDAALASATDVLQRRLALDFTRRLADGILFGHDKMCMAHSLELRMPFLDRSVVDFALRLPSSLKLGRGRREKHLLSRLARSLPEIVAGRRKSGLHYPERMLVAEPNRTYVRELLLDANGSERLFQPAALEALLGRCLAAPGEGTRLVWMLVVLQCWWTEFFGA